MLRRLHAARVFVGEVSLDPTQARHARDVLRLPDGTSVELFDDAGHVAVGTLLYAQGSRVVVKVEAVALATVPAVPVVVASAIPKGERADWMVEKLSELGVVSFIPLAAARSVTVPAGKGKFERWARIATESAKQSRRAGVMSIDPLTTVSELIAGHPTGLLLSTAPDSLPFTSAIDLVMRHSAVIRKKGEAPADSSQRDPGSRTTPPELLLAIGPEGGWTDPELARFAQAGFVPTELTPTVLRTETAAITAAALVTVLALSPPKAEGTR